MLTLSDNFLLVTRSHNFVCILKDLVEKMVETRCGLDLINNVEFVLFLFISNFMQQILWFFSYSYASICKDIGSMLCICL